MEKSCSTESNYKKHKERLLALILSRVSDKETARDILHDTFEKFELSCQSGCRCKYPKSYLFKIALNTVTDYMKKKHQRKKTTQPVEIIQISDTDYTEFPCDVYQCVYKYLSKLSLANQDAFIKSDIQNISQKKIAEQLGIPVSTLKSRVQRTRNFLKKEFEKCLSTY